MKIQAVVCLASLLAALSACAPKATSEDARKFTQDAERNLLSLNIDSGRADWIKSTYIIDDTEAIDAKLDERAINAQVSYAKDAARFDGLNLDAPTARKLKLLKTSLTLATPKDPKESAEVIEKNGGDDGARTRDLRRDRPAF